eukprot:84965-Amphidinium_carterae.1
MLSMTVMMQSSHWFRSCICSRISSSSMSQSDGEEVEPLGSARCETEALNEWTSLKVNVVSLGLACAIDELLVPCQVTVHAHICLSDTLDAAVPCMAATGWVNQNVTAKNLLLLWFLPVWVTPFGVGP